MHASLHTCQRSYVSKCLRRKIDTNTDDDAGGLQLLLQILLLCTTYNYGFQVHNIEGQT